MSSGVAKIILQDTVKANRKRGRQKKRWEGIVKEWKPIDLARSTRAGQDGTGLLRRHMWCPNNLEMLWD